MLLNPTNPDAELQRRDVQTAATAVGQQLRIFNASTESDLDAVFASLVRQRADALLVGNDVFFTNRREQIVAQAARHAIPAIYAFRSFAEGGGLMSYGIDVPDVYRQIGLYAARILQGAKPADLPVLQPTKFELVINLKTARALGLQIPDKLLALADEVIE